MSTHRNGWVTGLAVLAALLVALPALGQQMPRRRQPVSVAGGGGDAAIGQSAQNASSTNPLTTTTGIPVAAGSTVVCGVTWGGAVSFTSLTASPTLGAPTLIGTEQTTVRTIRFYYWQNVPADTYTFTLNLSGLPSGNCIACVELNNVQTSGVLDVNGWASDTTGPNWADAGPSVTPSQADTVLVGWSAIDDSAVATITPASGWTVQQEHDGSGTIPFVLQTRIVSSIASYTIGPYTRTGTNGTSDSIAAFKD